MKINHLNLIVAHNGVEVLTLTPVNHTHTEFDEIMLDWRRQQIQKRKEKTESKLKKVIKAITRKGE